MIARRSNTLQRRLGAIVGCAPLALLVMLVGIARGAFAQTIEFTRPETFPVLPAPTLMSSMMRVLEDEAVDLSREAQAAETETLRTALHARASYRRLAGELLALGERGGPVPAADPTDRAETGSVIILMGMKLAIGRELLDQAVARAVGVDGAAASNRQQSASIALAAFSQAYADHVIDGAPTGVTVDQWAAALVWRLLPVVYTEGENPPRSHWALGRASGATATDGQPQSQPSDRLAASLAALRQEIEAADFDEQSRTQLRSVMDFLDRGQQFADLQPRVMQYAQAVGDVVRCAQANNAAAWLNQESRQSLRGLVVIAIAGLVDPATREGAIELADRLRAMAGALEAATALEAEGVDAKALRSAMLSAIAASTAAGSGAQAVRPMTQLSVVLERMAAYRDLPASGFGGDFRNVERELSKRYRESEQEVLNELANGSLPERLLADPAMSSLLADHRQRLEDLERLRRMPQWSAAIARIYPPASKDFENQLKRWSQGMLEPSRRDDVILTMNRFERELALFAQPNLPFESSLAEARPEAIELCAGEHEQVLKVVIEQRRAWADDWSRQEQTPAPAQVMARTQRMLATMRDAAALTRLDPALLNRWPAWQVSAETIDRERRDVITRLKLAAAALIRGDHGGLGQQLDRIADEAPLAMLAGRLAHVLGDELAECRSDAGGVLTQLAFAPPAPPHSAALIGLRPELAALCRCVCESAFAQSNGDVEAATRINAYVRQLVGRLLDEVP